MGEDNVDYAELPEVLRILRINMIDAYMKMRGYLRGKDRYYEVTNVANAMDGMTTYVDLPDSDGYGGGRVEAWADGAWTALHYDTHVRPFEDIRSVVDSINRRWNALPDPAGLTHAQTVADKCRGTITVRTSDSNDTYMWAGNLQTQYTQIAKYNQAELLSGRAIDAFTTSYLNVLPLAVDALSVFAARRQILIALQQGALEGVRKQLIVTLKGYSDQFAMIADAQPQWQVNMKDAGDLIFKGAIGALGEVTASTTKAVLGVLSVAWDTFEGLRDASGGTTITVVADSAFEDQVVLMQQGLDDVDSNLRKLENELADIAHSFCDALADGIREHLTATGYVTSDFITSDEVGTIVKMDPEAVDAIFEALRGTEGSVDSIYDQLAEAKKHSTIGLTSATYRTRIGKLSYGAGPAIEEMGALIDAELQDFMWETENAANNLKAAFDDFSASEAESSRALAAFEASLDSTAQAFDPSSVVQGEAQRERHSADPSDRHLHNIAALMGDDG